MKLLFKLLAFFLFTQLCWANSPTEEGLFRNGDNPDISGDLIVYKIHINSKKEIVPEVTTETAETNNVTENSTSETEAAPTPTALTAEKVKTEEVKEVKVETQEEDNYIKVLVFNNTESTPQYLFLYYNSPNYDKNSLVKIIPVMNQRNIITSQYDETSQILVGLLQMFTMNQSTPLVNYLKQIEPNFKTNREALNQEKVNLYKNYATYLRMLKENPDLKDDETVENPRFPKDEDKAKKVKGIESMPMYTPSEAISLQRVDNTFFWYLSHNNIQAQFYHSTMFLNQLKIKSVFNYKIDVENFVLYTNVFLLPPQFIMNIEGKEIITVIFDKYDTYPKSNATITERVDYYSKQIESNLKEKEEKKSDIVLVNGEAVDDYKEKPFINLLYRLK